MAKNKRIILIYMFLRKNELFENIDNYIFKHNTSNKIEYGIER